MDRTQASFGFSGSIGHKGVLVDLDCTKTPQLGSPSERTSAIGAQFGLPLYSEPVEIIPPAHVLLEPGRIVLFLGPSGGGKSTALGIIRDRFPDSTIVQGIHFPEKSAIVDEVAPGRSLNEAVGLLTHCGLGEARFWIRRFDELSEGEQFRARLARAIGFHKEASELEVDESNEIPILLCDEFCSNIHRLAAKAISYSLRKLATLHGLCIVLASVHEDIRYDLQPDTTVQLLGNAQCQIEHHQPARQPISIRHELRIEKGCKQDYDKFSAMHYRATDELGFVDKVFVLRNEENQTLGIVVYSHGPLELALRNKATEGIFIRNPSKMNKEMRILRRLVIHPDVRGCGLGHFLVENTLPMVGTAYVECLASMGDTNPVFERAGMERIGQCKLPAICCTAIKSLKELGLDPICSELSNRVSTDRHVKRIVEGVVRAWYAATTGGGSKRVEKQQSEFLTQAFRGLIGSRPVYYLWRRNGQTTDSAKTVSQKE